SLPRRGEALARRARGPSLTRNCPLPLPALLNVALNPKCKHTKMSVLRGKGSARKSKQIVKTSLNNPYIPQWRTLAGEDMHFVLQALEEVMKQIEFKKIEDQKRMKPTSRKRRKKEECSNLLSKFNEDKGADDPKAHGWSDMQIRNQLAIGINELPILLDFCKKEQDNNL
ncbi:hypothetical protein E2320_001724, partial [Naja naja]